MALFAAVFTAPAPPAFAADGPTVSLTAEEQAWVRDHPRIRVHNETAWPPFNFAKDGKPQGYSIDFMNLVAEKVGLEVEYVTGPSWNEFLGMMKSGDLDVMLNIVATREREKYLLFTPPYAANPNTILSRTDTPYTKLEQLFGKTVSVPKGFFHEEILARDYPRINLLPVRDTLESMKAVSLGKADAAVGELAVFNHLLGENMLGGLAVSGELKLGEDNLALLHIATRKDLPVLASILTKGVAAVSVEERRWLQKKWIATAPSPRSPAARPDLTAEEKTWIAEHPKVRLGTDPAWPPFDFVDANGKHTGYTADLLALLGERSGISIERVPDLTWKQAVDGVRNRSVDLLTVCARNAEREKFMRFTLPILSQSWVVATRTNADPVANLEALSGKRVVVAEGYSVIKLIEAKMNLPYRTVPTPLDGLKAVAFNQADAYVGYLGVISHLIQENGLTNVKIAGHTGLPDQPMTICVRSDWPELVSILNKTLTAVRPETTAIRQKWIPVSLDPQSGTGTKPTLSLTDEEKAWIRDHPRIRVHNETDWPPFNFAEGGVPKGFSIDFMNHVAEKVGLGVDYVTGPSWNEFMEMMKRGDLDVMLNIVKTPERQEFLLYTPPYANNLSGILAQRATPYRSLEELSGKTVCVPKGFFYEKILEKDHPEIKRLALKGVAECMKAVSFGRADAALGKTAVFNHLRAQHLMTDVMVTGEVELGDPELSRLNIATRKDLPILASILSKGVEAVGAEERRAIQNKWLLGTLQLPEQDSAIELTPEEKGWLKDHPTVGVANELDWPPFDFVQNGRPAGLTIDTVRLAAKKVGMNVRFVNGYSWMELVEKFKAGEVDVLPAIYFTPERRKTMAFTRPYADNPSVLVARQDRSDIRTLDDLGGQRIAVIKGFATAELLSERFPDAKQVPVESALDGLKAVAFGQADGFVGSLGVIGYLLDNTVIPDIQIVGEVWLKEKSETELRMSVLDDRAILRDILQKGLDAISDTERREIRSRWLPRIEVRTAQGAEGAILSTADAVKLAAAVIGGVIVLLGLAWVARRTASHRFEKVFEDGGMKTEGVVAVGLFLVIVVLAAAFVMDKLEQETRARMEGTLNTILNSAHKTLNIWAEGNIRHINTLATNRWLQILAEKMLRVPRDRESLIESSIQADLRAFFETDRKLGDNLGFFLIAPDNINIASMRDANLGDESLIARQRPEYLARVFQGETLLIPPLRSDVKLKDDGAPQMEKPATMFFAAPVRDQRGRVIAAMTLRIDVAKDFMRTFEIGRLGDSGEIYAVGPEGHLLSETRFNDEIRTLGLVGEHQRAILNVRVADPGGSLADGHPLPADPASLPLTRAAADIVAGRDGSDVQGYRDYRGTRVLGTWAWEPALGMGLIGEIDEEEALATYYLSRNWVMGLLAATVLLALGLTGFSVWVGQSATRSLTRSRDSAEEARLVAEGARSEAEQAEGRLREKVEEVERFNRLAVGRETRIAELKEQINSLSKELGKEAPFAVTDATAETEPVDDTETDAEEEVELSRLLDLEELQALLENFCNAVGIASAIIDLEGKILAAARWQRACTDFHRVNEQTCARCIESDTGLATELQEGKAFTIYKCKNGLTDAASPITIGGKQVANVFIGQFLLGEPDQAFFRQQAKDVGFDEAEYMKAIGEVPVVSEEKLPNILSFLTKFAKLIAQLSMERLKAERAGVSMQRERIAAMNLAEDAEIARKELDAYKDQLEDLVKERTQELEAASEKLGLALSSMSDGIFLLDSELNYVMFNDRYKELLGLPDGLIEEGKPVRDVVRFLAERGDYSVDDIDAWVEERMRQIAKAESARVEINVKDGPILELRQSPTTDGGVVVIASDVTERKRAEAAVKEAEERGRLILESAGEAIFGLDVDGTTTFVNPAACEMLGYAPDELVGQALHALVHHSYPDGTSYPREKCHMRAAFHDGEIHHVEDEVLWRKDGTAVAVEYTSTPIRKGGRLVGAVVTCRDITERLRVQRELAEKMEELEKFSKVAVGRELRMIKLKEQINTLKEQLGEKPEYEIAD